MATNAATFRRPVGAPAGNAHGRSRGFISARAVGTYVPKLTHKAFEKYGFAAAALITDWAMIVGKDVAAYTAPERLKWPRGVGIGADVEVGAEGRPGATLIVRVEPARALDVQYNAQQMLERINGHFGYRAVAELRILQAPLPERAGAVAQPRVTPTPCAAPELSNITDERLRTALATLKSGLMSRSQAR
jgi:hypothetical protein